MWLALLLACPPADTDVVDPVDTDVVVDTDHGHGGGGGHEGSGPQPLRVVVTLDGAPIAGVGVWQGGVGQLGVTGADGGVDVIVDRDVNGDVAVIASHPDARQKGDIIGHDDTDVQLDLVSFDPSDNEDYVFMAAGKPGDDVSSLYCVHCHKSMIADWWASPHRQAASNPFVQDTYRGTASALSASACAAIGGVFATGDLPGGGTGERCGLGDGVIDLPDCDACEPYGGCASCHAPGIDGALAGRDLRDAVGTPYEEGVHCDVCHHVEDVDVDDPRPGVAGRLHVVRPSEETTIVGIGDWLPMVFGPHHDSPNIRMGSVQRDHFRDGRLCAGCHQNSHAPLTGAAADPARWPDGTLPIDTTWPEWAAGPLGQAGVACNACHMPPDSEATNGVDLTDISPGVAGGWVRAPGEVRHHAWYGPRQPESGMHELAAWVRVDARRDGEDIVADVLTENVGCAHAVPGGVPLRQAILVVEATCDGEPLAPTGGDAIDALGGYAAAKAAGEDWARWPGAAVGDTIRVVRRTGAWRDDPGWGPFGDGTFVGADKGLPEERVVGAVTVTAVAGDRVTTDAPIPDGDVAYRVSGAAWAGAPGRLFQRVLVGADGARGVPDHLAVDVASDNRLLPYEPVSTTHRFRATCEAPEVTATLWWRRFPMNDANRRGWPVDDLVLTQDVAR